jgi:hypothetical protein
MIKPMKAATVRMPLVNSQMNHAMRLILLAQLLCLITVSATGTISIGMF